MTEKQESMMIKGMNLGMEMAVSHARGGRLRLSPLPFEQGEHPYTIKLRPFRATALIWKSWFMEKTKGGY